MAGSDYYNCDSCGAGKIFYDARVDWEGYGDRIGQVRAICDECFARGVNLKVVNKVTPGDHNRAVHYWTEEGKPLRNPAGSQPKDEK